MSFLFADPADDAIAEATSELALRGEPDMIKFLAISDKIKTKSFTAKDAIRSIKRRLQCKNPNAVMLALDLTDVCVKNAGQLFLVEAASKDFMDNLYQMVKSQTGTNIDVRKKILELIQSWGQSFKGSVGMHLSGFSQTYVTLKAEGFTFPTLDQSLTAPALFTTLTVPEWTDSDQCTRCRSTFTSFLRKHHCRSCGCTFCAACSSKTRELPDMGVEERVRVCDLCDVKYEGKGVNDPLRSSQGREYVTSSVKEIMSTEEEDFEMAIAESLKVSNASKAKIVVAAPIPVEESDDEELNAAIKASLAVENEKQARLEEDAIRHQQQQQQQSIEPQTKQLTAVEQENVSLFAQLVNQVEKELAQNGPSRIDFQQLHNAHTQVVKTQQSIAVQMSDSLKKMYELRALNEMMEESARYLRSDQTLQQAAYPQNYGQQYTNVTSYPRQSSPSDAYQPQHQQHQQQHHSQYEHQQHQQTQQPPQLQSGQQQQYYQQQVQQQQTQSNLQQVNSVYASQLQGLSLEDANKEKPDDKPLIDL